MIPYIILYFSSTLLSFYTYLKERTNAIPFLLFILAVGIFAGSRLNLGGYDYDVYELMYNNTNSNFSDVISPDYFLLQTTEKGYVFLMSIFRFLNTDFNTFFIFLGLFCTLGLFFVFRQYSKFPYLILTIFLAKGYLYYFFTAQRQILAMVVCWIALKAAIERKLIPFLLLIVLASFFHTSALAFVIVYPIITLKLTNKKVIILLAGAILIGVFKIGILLGTVISGYLPFGADKLTGYLEGETTGVNILNFIEMIPILFIILHFRKKLEGKVSHFNALFNIYLVFVLITFAFYDFVFIARLKGYFLIGYIVILSTLCYIPQVKRIGIGIVFLLLCYCFAVYVRELLTFDDGEGYLPYRSYLFNNY
ncbi:EpsG family protein [Chryseobacterium indologenes]|uniref:EpsG family protein n=1 Tax=Chryseobacterium TaxID=59732 RepID=UPI001627B0CE|nr:MULTISPECIES: EpsG family protein [Chryseobacterium]MDM1556710.1 EpsG family protein [Chryseobacterium indologenes]WET51528.1 EpsG family protein [Chryseobacterium indologenes]